MFSAPTGPIAVAALTGGVEALADVLACSSAGRSGRCWPPPRPTWPTGVEKVGRRAFAVDTKLDGIRIQVHKHGDEVSVFTRSLDEITARLPEVVAVARALPAHRPGPRRRGDRARRRRPAAPVPGDRVRRTATHARRDRHPAVLLRPAAPRRRRPDRGPATRAPRRGSTQSCPEELACRRAGHRRPPTRRRQFFDRRGRRRAGGRDRQAPRCAVRRRPARVGLGQGQAAAHPRPRRARRRVGQRPARRAGSPTSTSARATRTGRRS